MDKWYVIRCSTNKEKESRDKIENEIIHTVLEKYVKQLIVPLEKTVQLRQGKKIITTRNNFPGYILIETDENSLGEISNAIKHINYVSGFLSDSTRKGIKGQPVCLKQHEIDNILGRMEELQGQEIKPTYNFIVDEMVKVIDGPFSDFIGKVYEYNKDKDRLKVNVLVFGRNTPIELNPMQVTKDI